MTPRSLFNIIIKVFALFFLREIINLATQLFSEITYLTSFDNPPGTILPLVLTVLLLVFYVFLIFQLLFKTNYFIDKLKLDQGFDEHEFSFDTQNKFSINISTTSVLTIALIVIGGVTLINEIPNFFRSIYLYLGEERSFRDGTKSNATYAIVSATKIIIGLLIIGERNRIIEFVEKRQNKNADEEKNETNL